MVSESAAWGKLYGKKICTERLSVEGFRNRIPFDIYDGYAVCEDFNGCRYDMSYPQLKVVKECKEMADAVVEYINSISAEENRIKVDDISVIHVLIAFNTMTRNGVEIKPRR